MLLLWGWEREGDSTAVLQHTKTHSQGPGHGTGSATKGLQALIKSPHLRRMHAICGLVCLQLIDRTAAPPRALMHDKNAPRLCQVYAPGRLAAQLQTTTSPSTGAQHITPEVPEVNAEEKHA